MIDGSQHPLEENIALTRAVVRVARPCGIPVEAELGKVGGKEDDLVSTGAAYTDRRRGALCERNRDRISGRRPSALRTAYTQEHQCWMLTVCAPFAGWWTSPWSYTVRPGLSDNAVRETIAAGICKVNFATELRIAYSDGIKACLAAAPGVYDPKKYGKAGMAA